jgi:hypothetical protein
MKVLHQNGLNAKSEAFTLRPTLLHNTHAVSKKRVPKKNGQGVEKLGIHSSVQSGTFRVNLDQPIRNVSEKVT